MNTENKNINVSVMVFTLNEEVNLPYCLDSLGWCNDKIVIDSFSTDNTEKICKDRGIQFYQRKFDGFGSQRNWALENVDIKYNWVLILDADERVTEALKNELDIISQKNPTDIGAYRVKRRLYMWGKWLRYSSLYPNWVVRFIHKDRVRYINRGHAETQEVSGKIEALEFYLIDENHKGIDDWYERQDRYSKQEAEYELLQKKKPVNISDLFAKDPLIRRSTLKGLIIDMPFRPQIYFIYSYIIRLGFLDGIYGFKFCIMKTKFQRMIVNKKHNIKN